MDRSGARLVLAFAERDERVRAYGEWVLRTKQRAGPVGLGMAVVLAILFGF